MMKNKICVITGANSGLGLESCKAIAGMGATIVMVCRSKEKGEAARRIIQSESQNEDIHLVIMDLASQKAIREGAKEIQAKWPRIDVLMNNAGAVISERSITEDGVEKSFAINHLGPFLLTHTLIGNLLKADEARIVNLSSNNHFKAKMYWDDLSLARGYNLLKAYGQTKLANVLFTYELERHLKTRGISNLTVNAVDPGANNTDIGTKRTNFLPALAWRIRRLWAMSPAEGAATQIHVSTSPDVKGITGKYWRSSRVADSSRISYDEEQAQRLWALSLEMCKIEDYFHLK